MKKTNYKQTRAIFNHFTNSNSRTQTIMDYKEMSKNVIASILGSMQNKFNRKVI